MAQTWHTLQKNARKSWAEEAEKADDALTVRRLATGKLLPSVRLHDLRHLHASVAIRSGLDAKVLADRLGHARASFTLGVYTHLFEEERANSAVSLLDFLPKDDLDNPDPANEKEDGCKLVINRLGTQMPRSSAGLKLAPITS